jgi:hypothetical protein
MLSLIPVAVGYGAIALASYVNTKHRILTASASPAVINPREKNAPVEENIDTSLTSGGKQEKRSQRTEQELSKDRDGVEPSSKTVEKVLAGDKSSAPLPPIVPLNYVKAPRQAVHARGNLGIGGRTMQRREQEQAPGFTPIIVGGWLPTQTYVSTETDSSGNVTRYRSQSSLRRLFGF